MDYNGKNKAVRRVINKWASPLLLSNKKEMVVCSPSPKGWVSKRVMEFDGYPIDQIADKVTALAHRKLLQKCVQTPHMRTEILRHTAHALVGVCHRFGVNVCPEECSTFQFKDDEEIELMRKYEAALHTSDAERRAALTVSESESDYS